MKFKILLSALIGVVCGIISVQFLPGSWGNLALWGAVGIALGYFLEINNATVWSGCVYGFFVTATFLVRGSLLLALALGILGAVCGFFLYDIGGWIRKN